MNELHCLHSEFTALWFPLQNRALFALCAVHQWANYSQSEWEVLDTGLQFLPCKSPWRYSWGCHLHTTHSCTLSQLFGSGYNQCVPQSSCKKSLQRRKIQRCLQTSPGHSITQQPGVLYRPHSSSCPRDKWQKCSSVFLSFLAMGLPQV